MKERILTNIEPKQVFKYFEDLTFIPRESGNEKEVSDYLVSFAIEHGLEYMQDDALNVIVRKPATPGYEDHPGIILQAHMDMVCAKKSWSAIDFTHDFIPFEVDGDKIIARETSLGADDGIGVAFILALLAAPSLTERLGTVSNSSTDEKGTAFTEAGMQHPQIEAIFTTEEETGLFGVEKLDYSKLTGEYVISLDAADEGVAVIGCAGGPVICSKIPVEFVLTKETGTALGNCDEQTVPMADVNKAEQAGQPAEANINAGSSFNCYKIKIQGLLGGHSGEDIHRGRAHAIKLMGRLLEELKGIKVTGPGSASAELPCSSVESGALEAGEPDFILCSFRGGDKSNAISRTAEVVVGIKKGYVNISQGEAMTLQRLDTAAYTEAVLEKYAEIFKEEYAVSDPGLSLTWEQMEIPEKILDSDSAKKIIEYINLSESGITRMDEEFPHLVESSVNLGAVRTRQEYAEFWHVVRSSRQEQADMMAEKIYNAAERLGGEYTVPAGSPPWQPDGDSKIRAEYIKVYEELFGKSPEVTVLHAALEPCKMACCAGRKLDMIAFGPDVRNLHAPGEYVTISSCRKLWVMLKALLARL